EWFLSVIASFVVAYHKQDVRIGYLSNGENVLGKNQLVITPQQEVRNVLDQMAELTDKVATTNEPLDEYVVMNNSRMPLYVFSKQLTDVHVEWIEKYKQMDITFYYIERNDFSDTFMHVAQQMNDLLQNKVVNG
ncbi:MAG TPA: hypothetical protein VK085_02820, partial [Pseudogracilibacillus sp.]|nr:hypothetical protein [Pseudogracilibacillus sp.]